ncbi:MAG: class I SAM-dependent methyltransferase [Pseudomonadota bacterium]
MIYDCTDEFLLRHSACYGGVVYDLGCGEAPYRNFFLGYCSRYIGVDWENSQHTQGADIAADLNQPLPIPDKSADLVVSISVLEHLYDPAMMLREAFRILKPGGRLLLQVPFMWQVHEAPHDYYRFTRFGLLHLLETAGFDAIDIRPTTGFWGMWTLKLNYQLRRLVRGPAPVRWVLGLFFGLCFWLNQHLARVLDRFWQAGNETAGYVVIANRPGDPA